MASQDSIGMQKKIIDLDPYKASVVETVAEDSETGKNVVVGQETVFEPDENPNENAAWVPATVKQGGNTRYTVRLPLPVAGDGLSQDSDGNLKVDVDPNTMEILPDGKLAAKTPVPAGIVFSSKIARLNNTFQPFDMATVVDKDNVLNKDDADKYGTGLAPSEGEVDFSASSTWIRIEALMHFTVAEYARSVWSYRCIYRVEVSGFERPIDVEFSLDTTESDTTITIPVQFRNYEHTPLRVKASLKWDRENEDDLKVECNAKISMTAI